MNARRLLSHPLAIAALGLLVLPQIVLALGFTYSTATEIAIMAMVAIGYNLLLGYTGLLSFGHGLFFGLAAYATTLSQIHWFKDSFFLPLLFAVGFSAVLGLIIGFLVLRRRGVYFSLVTLALTALVFYIVYRWTSFTGGENGLSGVKRVSVLGLDLDSQTVFYWFISAIVFLVACSMWRVVHSPLGSVLKAIRENETRARFVGYPVASFKLAAFVISATVTGFGGALTAY
ncbi:MAG: branched-chain amino acid ABC transporter permease, partial [Burkholderiales bacterium]